MCLTPITTQYQIIGGTMATKTLYPVVSEKGLIFIAIIAKTKSEQKVITAIYAHNFE